MTYDFPPPVPTSINLGVFLLYVLILGFALAAILRVFAWHETTSPQSRLRRIWISLGLSSLIALGGLIHPNTRGRIQEYLGFFAILLGCLAVMTLVRHFRERPPSIIRAPVALLIATMLAMGLSPLPAPFRNLSPPAPWESDCHNNLRVLSILHDNAAAGRGGALPSSASAGIGTVPASWRLEMLNYMERPFDDQGRAYSPLDGYDFDQPWDAPDNLAKGRVCKSQYYCRWNPFPVDDAGRYYTNYARITGPTTAFDSGKRITLNEISEGDGLAHTILLGECSGLNIVWTEPRDIDVAKQKIGINLPGERPRTSSSILSSYHPGGAYAAFADGRVEFLSEKIDPRVLRALTTTTGGESVPEDSSW